MVRRMPGSEIYSEPASGVTIDLKIVVEDFINQLEAARCPSPGYCSESPARRCSMGGGRANYLTGVTAKSNHQYFKLMHYRIVSGESYGA